MLDESTLNGVRSTQFEPIFNGHAVGEAPLRFMGTNGLWRGALEEAAQLIDCVLEHTEQDVICAELHAMAVDVWARLGRWRSALRHCGHLKRYVVGLKGSVELSLRTASLLGLMNRYETAQNVLDGALEKLGDLSEQPALAARVISERGEMSFKLGCYTEAMEEAQRALDLLATAREREMIQAHIHDRAVLSARNLAGKVDIMLGRMLDNTGQVLATTSCMLLIVMAIVIE